MASSPPAASAPWHAALGSDSTPESILTDPLFVPSLNIDDLMGPLFDRVQARLGICAEYAFRPGERQDEWRCTLSIFPAVPLHQTQTQTPTTVLSPPFGDFSTLSSCKNEVGSAASETRNFLSARAEKDNHRTTEPDSATTLRKGQRNRNQKRNRNRNRIRNHNIQLQPSRLRSSPFAGSSSSDDLKGSHDELQNSGITRASAINRRHKSDASRAKLEGSVIAGGSLVVTAVGVSEADARSAAERQWMAMQPWWAVFADRLARDVLRTEHLVRGENMAEEEGVVTEFKGPREHKPWDFNNLQNSFKLKAAPAVCGFLNRGVGGVIFFGIHDEGGTVEGAALDHKERDEVKLLWTSLSRFFYPALAPRQVRLRLREVAAAQGDEMDADLQKQIGGKRLYVVEVSAIPRPPGGAPVLYFWKDDAYIRHESSTLKMKAEQVVRAMRAQIVFQLMSSSV